MAKSDANMIERTRAFWAEKTGMVLTPEDAREILSNVTAFFQMLGEWDRRQKAKGKVEDRSCDETRQPGKEIA